MTVHRFLKNWAGFGWRKPTSIGEVTRFVIAGSTNTLATLLLYQVLVSFVRGDIAYAISWLAGLAFVLLVYPTRVFVGGDRSGKSLATAALIYSAIFLLGLAALGLANRVGLSPRLAILPVIATTTVLNFLLAKSVFHRR